MGMLSSGYNPGSSPDIFSMEASANNAALSGIQEIAKLGSLGQSQRITDENQAHQQEEWGRQNQFRKMFSDAWQSGDNAALDRVMGMFPEFIPQMQQALGLKDDQHNQKVASLMMKLNGLVNSGDTAGVRKLLQENQSLLNPGDMEHWNSALAAMDGKDKNAAAQARQGLDQFTKAMIRASFKNPTQMMESMLHQSQQEETARRDSQAHEDRIRGQNISASNARYRASHPGPSIVRRWRSWRSTMLFGKRIIRYRRDSGRNQRQRVTSGNPGRSIYSVFRVVRPPARVRPAG